jgi:hypothetical protein
MPRAAKIRADWSPVMQSSPTMIAAGRSLLIGPA